MADQPRTIIVCSCEDTMPLDVGAVRKGCKASVLTAGQLCRRNLTLPRRGSRRLI